MSRFRASGPGQAFFTKPGVSDDVRPRVPLTSLLTRKRWIEIGRIAITAIVILLFWRGVVPVSVLWLAVAFGLYPLAKKGVQDLVRERRVGTEVFVTLATLVALIGGEAIAGAVLMVIILIAEFIAELNTDRARASIRGLIGSIPQTALLREGGQERRVSIDELKPGMVVLVRAGEKIPVDGKVSSGTGAVNEAPITGESVPKDKSEGAPVFAGTVLESGAIEVRTEKAGADTTFARIVKLVEEAEESQAPVQKLADRVSAWLIPVVFVFLLAVFLFTHDVRKIVTLMIFTSPAELGLATP
ncbi:MAG: HAD-IC family P-type ATPase, partial [Acidobacteriota bacterium]